MAEKRKRKRPMHGGMLLAAGVGLAAVALILLILLTGKNGAGNQNQNTTLSNGTTESAGANTEASKPTAPSTEQTEGQTQPPSTLPPETQPPTTKPPVTEPPATEPPATEPPKTEPPQTRPPVTEPNKTGIDLPYTIPGTDLVIQYAAPYSGIFVEDGSDDMVSNVAMVLLYNAGDDAVEYSKITMRYDDQTLEFIVSALPAGGKVAAQEINRKPCGTGDLVECFAENATRDTLDMCENSLKVQDNGDNSLTITNLTDQQLVTVRIFYKYYLAEEDAFIGGITYTSKISNLPAGESIVITPSHYASEGGKVVMVRIYDEDV